MYRKIFMCLCLLLVSGTIAEALEPEVVSVDFYPSGAKFVFRLTPDKAGDFEFTLPGAAFSPDSVRLLRRDGSASLRAESVAVKPEPFPELEPLEQKADEKRRELKLCEARVNANSQALSMLRLTASSFDAVDILDYVGSMVDRASEKRLKYELELVDLEIEAEKAKEELKDAEEELQLLRDSLEARRPYQPQAVLVKGSALKIGPILFEAYAYDAGWSVRYDVNLNSETGLVDAVMFAGVRQKTGFDFEGELGFHTRAPSTSIVPPNLPPLPVRLAGDLRARQWNAMEESMAPAEAPMMMMDMAAPAPKQAPGMMSTLANVSVKGNGKVKGDGVTEDIELGRFEFTSATQLVAIPEQSREAWVVASLDVIPEPLLPGEAELYVDGTASGKTYIPDIGLQSTLPFGMAPRVTAEKKRAVSKTGSTWLGLGKGTLQDGYTIEVVNNMDTEREIEVRDRLPLPTDDKITLENVKIDPAAVQDAENKLTWKLKLRPGETGKISVEYTLRYPSDDNLVYW